MIRTMVVPLDGSQTAEAALPVAAGLARRLHARLLAVHALDFTNTEYAHCDDAPDWWGENVMDRAARYLEVTAAISRKKWQVELETRLIESDPLSALLRSPVSKKADLIVMTTHGRGPVERVWLGSVADQLIREAGRPILLIPPGARTEPHDDTPFSHIMVPLDGSATAEHVVPLAAAIATADGARLTLVRVATPALVNAIAHPHVGSGDDDEAYRYLMRRSGAFRLLSRDLQCVALAGDRPTATQILNYAATHDVDMIAMSTHGYGGLRRLVLGSIADKIIRASPVPVLVSKAQRNPIPGEFT